MSKKHIHKDVQNFWNNKLDWSMLKSTILLFWNLRFSCQQLTSKIPLKFFKDKIKMKLVNFFIINLSVCLFLIWSAFDQEKQFYPSVVRMTKSPITVWVSITRICLKSNIDLNEKVQMLNYFCSNIFRLSFVKDC